MNNNKIIIDKLTKIKNDLFFIDKFTEATDHIFNRQLAEISVNVEKVSKLIEKFKILDTKKKLSQNEINNKTDLAITVLSNNFDITNKKVFLMETHTKEIYGKINLLGKSLTDVCNLMIQLQNSITENQEKNINDNSEKAVLWHLLNICY